MTDEIDEAVNGSGKFLRLSADMEHPMDRHCACGRIILTWGLACEVCDPEQLPTLLQKQAA